jgi:hypothetical protein
VRGWSVARRLVGFVAAGAVVTTTVVAARHDPDATATAVEPVAVTAWLPGPDGTAFLADARHRTAAWEVPLGYPTPALTQAGDLAVDVHQGNVVVLEPATREDHRRINLLPGAVFGAGSATAAWLVSPVSPSAVRVTTSAPGRLSDPVPVPTGLTPGRTRVADDGTLWTVADGELRGIAPGTPARVVPLPPGTDDGALTIVDGDPVVIDGHGAHHLDRGSLTFDAVWPLDLPGPGPIVAAERSASIAVVRTRDRLAVTGPGFSAVVPIAPATGDPAPPVEQGGLVYVTDPATHQIHVHDPRQASGRQLVRQIPVPGRGALTLVGHRGRVWYSQRSASATAPDADQEPGIITEEGTARPLTRSRTTLHDPRRQGDGTGGVVSLPGGDPRTEAPEPDDPSLDDDGPCLATYPTARCPTDRSRPEPGSRTPPDASSIGCPAIWLPESCTAVGAGAGTGTGNGGTGDTGGTRDPDGHPTTTPPTKPPRLAGEGDRLEDARDALQRAGYPTTERAVPSLRPQGRVVGIYRNGQPVGDNLPPPPTPLEIRYSDGSRPVIDVDFAGGGRTSLCVVTEDHLVACWGSNDGGLLGPARPVGTGSAEPVYIPGVTTAEAVSAANEGACALLTGGGVTCWGNGLPDRIMVNAPRPIRTIDNGCGIDTDDRVWCWDNDPRFDFQLAYVANARLVDHAGPARYISAHCTVKTSGNVHCWGYNTEYHLGARTNDDLPHDDLNVWDPTTGADLTGAISVHQSEYVGCARTDHGVFCWGSLIHGDPQRSDPAPTRKVDGLDQVLDLDLALSVNCAVVPDKTIRCWGYLPGLMGRAGEYYANQPGKVSDIDAVEQVATESDYLCAVKDDRSLWCWGSVPPYELTDFRQDIPPTRRRIEPPT